MAESLESHQRDIGLDLARGFACVLMFIAHFPLFDKLDKVTYEINFFGGLAPAVFFSVTGILVKQQLSRYRLKSVVVMYAFIFVLGFSYNATIIPFLTAFNIMEIFQIIALGTILVACCEHYLKPDSITYLLIGFALLVANWIVMVVWPRFNGFGIVMPTENYVPHYLLPIEAKPVFPGFPILPWLYTFFIGCGLYGVKKSVLVLFVIASPLMLLAIEMLGVDTGWRNKWAMTPGYSLLSIFFMAVVLLIVRSIPKADSASLILKNPFNWILFFGANSLLFLASHLIGVFVALLFGHAGQYVAWIVGVVVTYAIMKGLLKLPSWKLLAELKGWYIIASICIFIVMIVPLNKALVGPVALIGLVIEILFAKHINYLSALIKGSK